MATLGTSWTTIATNSQTKLVYDTYYGYNVNYTITYTLQAKLDSQSTDNNQSSVSTRAQISVSPGNIDTYNLNYSCTGCTSHTGNNSTKERVPTGTVLTGSKTIDHADNGTGSLSMSGSFSCNFAGYSFSASGSIDLPTIPRNSSITSFAAFTIEDGFTFGYRDELASKTLTLTCKLGNTSILTKTYTSSVGTHSDTITFTANQLSTIYGSNGLGSTNKSGTFTLTLATSGISSTSSKTATGTLKTSSNKPTLSGASMTETQLTSYGVGSTEIIRYLSKKRISVTATGVHNATISSVKVKNGSSAEVAMTLSNGVYSAVLQNLSNSTFTITATDSRGLTSSTTLTGTLKAYAYPAITKVEFDRDSAVVSSGYINPSGTYWNGTAGSTTNSVTWTYTLNSGTAVSGTTANLTKSGNTWSDTKSLSSGTLDRETAYECVVTVTDSLAQTASYTITLGIAQLSLWLGKYTVKADGIVGNHFIGVFPVGAIYLSTTNTNPSTYFGGTWERIAQGRALIGAGSIEANTRTAYGTVTAGEFNPTAGTMGGEVTHTLTTDEIPSHTHRVWENGVAGVGTGTYGPEAYLARSILSSDGELWPTFATGGDGAHNNIMPYLAIYVWKRTA